MDWVARNLYWTDPGREGIQVASLGDGTRLSLLEGELESPRSIAVHPGLGRMFWLDKDRLGHKIEMANLDGTERRVSPPSP